MRDFKNTILMYVRVAPKVHVSVCLLCDIGRFILL